MMSPTQFRFLPDCTGKVGDSNFYHRRFSCAGLARAYGWLQLALELLP